MGNPMHQERDLQRQSGDSGAPDTPAKTYTRKRFGKERACGVSLSGASRENDETRKEEDFGEAEADCFGLNIKEEGEEAAALKGCEAGVAEKPEFEGLFVAASTLTHQGHEQNEEKKKEENNVVSSTGDDENKFCKENLVGIGDLALSMTPTRLEKNSKKRKKDGIDLSNRLRKTPKKKVHTPKVIGEGKRKRPIQPKTPKLATPKRISTKQSVSVSTKKKGSLKNLFTVSEQVDSWERVDATLSCRRSLNFEMELSLEVQSGITQVDEANVSLGDSIKSLTGSGETLTIDQHSPFFNSSMKMSLISPNICKKKRIMRRIKRRDLMLELPLVVKTKKKRSKGCTPRKDLSIFTGIVPCKNLQTALHGELVQERQECHSVQLPKAKTDVSSAGGTELRPSSLKTEFGNGKGEESLSEHENLLCDYKPIDIAEEIAKTCFASKSILPDLNLLPDGGNVISLLEHGDSSVTTQLSGLQHEHSAEVPAPEKAQNANSDVPLTEMPGQGQLSVVKKTKIQVMLETYAEEICAWKLEVKRICSGIEDNAEKEAKEKLENERAVFRDRIKVFIACMHLFLGDRKYAEWKGSVIDSAIGVFLTQNVSDTLSSSAFMHLKARFPVQSSSSSSNHENRNSFDSQESVGRSAEFSRPWNHIVGPKLLSNKEAEYISDIEDIVPNGQETSSVGPRLLLSNPFLTSECNVEENTEIMDQKSTNDEPRSSADDSSSAIQEMWDGESSKSKEHPNEKKKTAKKKQEKDNEVQTDWEEVRKKYCRSGERREEHKDSVDWEAVRCAPASEIADAIKNRGQHNNIADRIKEFLNRVVEMHKTLDLEWLRDAPPDIVKKYLLEFNGLGLKSVECIRLLALRNVAFPVDTNVGRIAVRLGWVPLEPLPEELQIHLLQKYPVMDNIQKYLWPRLSTLNQLELYELHYHLITFGKVFCTKRNPNCNSCPMKGDCRHYASQYASARRTLPGPARKKKASSSPLEVAINLPSLLEANQYPELSQCQNKSCEPIIEEPPSPEPERIEPLERDIEDYFAEDDTDGIPTIRLSRREPEVSTALVPLAPEVATYPAPKLKHVSRLRTRHLVYELPDSHPLLTYLDKRDPHDLSPYLLSIWTPDETTSSSQTSEERCSSQECGNLSNAGTHSSCSSHSEHNNNTVRGTFLIPCRTAMKGSFPLNATYFQVNEVFADHESSHNPVDVSRELLWNLQRRIVYFGTSTSSIFGGMTTEEIRFSFWRGFMCVRAYDRRTGTPKPLALRLHISTTQQAANRKKKEGMEDQ